MTRTQSQPLKRRLAKICLGNIDVESRKSFQSHKIQPGSCSSNPAVCRKVTLRPREVKTLSSPPGTASATLCGPLFLSAHCSLSFSPFPMIGTRDAGALYPARYCISLVEISFWFVPSVSSLWPSCWLHILTLASHILGLEFGWFGLLLFPHTWPQPFFPSLWHWYCWSVNK